MNLPMLDELCLAPKLSRPDSESRSLPVKCIGLTSVHVVVMVWPSPKGRLAIDSQVEAVMSVRARSVPSQSLLVKKVEPDWPAVYVARWRLPAYNSPRLKTPAAPTSATWCPSKS